MLNKLTILFLLIILLASCQEVSKSSSSYIELNDNIDAIEFVNLVNLERARYGLCPLDLDENLCQVAKKHSSDMRNCGRIFHQNPLDGCYIDDRLDENEIDYKTAGENVACGHNNAESVFNAWMKSPDHRDNIIDPNYTHIGVGLSSPGSFWTVVFIKK